MTRSHFEEQIRAGIVALQRGLIPTEALLDAFRVWESQPDRTVLAILRDGGTLSEQDSALIESMTRATPGTESDASATAVSDSGVDDPNATLTHVSSFNSGGGETRVPTDVSSSAAAWTLHDVPSEPRDESRYRIIQLHDRGGLGEVFVARDRELDRNVALKQLQTRHADDPNLRARFMLEAAISGGLEHPGIVPVYGLGTYRDGRPYYAMRFIKGDTLKSAAERFHADQSLDHDPSRREVERRRLLSRFLDVCNAISYAHSRDVVHRDLKPGNVMLGAFGETLVVDWGLAKSQANGAPPDLSFNQGAIDSSTARSGVEATEVGSRMGTPAYMSPEQAAGRVAELGPRTDIYSLGATLYYVLTGQAPFVDRDLRTLLDKVERGDFAPPRAVNPKVEPALDAICLRAMAREPEARYASVQELADDLENWLADEPVAAFAEPWTDRARRWLRRHRTAVVGAVAAACVALISLAGLAWFEAHSRRELAAKNVELNQAGLKTNAALRRAESSFRKAVSAVDESLTKVAENKRLESLGLHGLRRDLLAAALRYYQDFLLEQSNDASLSAEVARAQFRVGEIMHISEGAQKALPAIEQAVNSQRQLLAARGNDRELRENLGDSLSLVGIALGELDRPDEGRRALEEACDVRQKLADETPTPQRLGDLAQALSNLGLNLDQNGQPERALATLTRAVEIHERLVAGEPRSVEFRFELAENLITLGHLKIALELNEDAYAITQRARDILAELYSSNARVEGLRSVLVVAYDQLGYLERQRGRFSEALKASDQAIALLSEPIETNAAPVRDQLTLATALNIHSDLLREMGRPDDAIAAARAAGKILGPLVEKNPNVYESRRGLSKSHDAAARILAARGERASAIAEFREAITHLERVQNLSPADTYNLACDKALLRGLLRGKPETERTAADEAERERLGAEATKLFAAAVEHGLRMLDHFRRDPDLDSLRDRPDFQDVLNDLAFPSDPFAHAPSGK